MKLQFTDERDTCGRLLLDREVWRQATTIAAAGELTARWLEGKSQYQPGTLSPFFDDETRPIAARLAEINRSGLFTKESQPGLPMKAGHAQREYVTGFCSAAPALHLLHLSAQSDLIAIGHAPGEPSRSSIPVTLQDEQVVTVLGTSESPIESAQIRDWAEETNETMALVLADSWYIEILDPVWGRSNRLLPAVLKALKSVPEGSR